MRRRWAVCLVIGLGVAVAFPNLSFGQAQQRQVDRFFEEADANKDGKLSEEELTTYMQAMAKRRAQQMFQKADTNKDGFVTKEELHKLRAGRRGMMMEHER